MSFIASYLNHVASALEHHTETERSQVMDVVSTMLDKFRVISLENIQTENKFDVFSALSETQLAYFPDFLLSVFPEKEMRSIETYNPAMIEIVCKYHRTLAEWSAFRNKTPDNLEHCVLTICDVSNTLGMLRDKLVHQCILKHLGVLEYLLEKYYDVQQPITLLLLRATGEHGLAFKDLYLAIFREITRNNGNAVHLDALFWIVYGAELVYLYHMENRRMHEYSTSIIETCSQEYADRFPNEMEEFMEQLELLDNAFEEMEPNWYFGADPVADFMKQMDLKHPLYFKRYTASLATHRYLLQRPGHADRIVNATTAPATARYTVADNDRNHTQKII
jgi:hypothetical protein